MLQKSLFFLRKLIPTWAFKVYHFVLALLGHALYGFPSRKLIVYGVTGTNGKTTTAVALGHILKKAGFRVAVSSSALFQIDDRVEANTHMVSMPGRFILPRFLSRAVQSGCQIAIVESTSEGALQYRHRFIEYDYFVFTNLRHEHIERHGSFENYKEAKLELFRQLVRSKSKKSNVIAKSRSDEAIFKSVFGIDTSNLPHPSPLLGKERGRETKIASRTRNDKYIDKGVVVNLDDEHASEFLDVVGDMKKVGVTFQSDESRITNHESRIFECHWHHDAVVYQASTPTPSGGWRSIGIPNGSDRSVGDYKLQVPGLFNAYNVALASAAATFMGIPFEQALVCGSDFGGVPGRFEVIQKGKVAAIVDYAHEPFSLEIVLKLAREKFAGTFVHVFGGTSGGRDIRKRPVMGSVSERFADRIVLTNDDPYDEDQMAIVSQIRSGIRDQSKVEVILDRAAAIERGIMLVREQGGVVLITGKGTENLMCFERGRKIPWSDRAVVEKFL